MAWNSSDNRKVNSFGTEKIQKKYRDKDKVYDKHYL